MYIQILIWVLFDRIGAQKEFHLFNNPLQAWLTPLHFINFEKSFMIQMILKTVHDIQSNTVKDTPQLSDLKGPGTSKLNNFEKFERKKRVKFQPCS